MKPILLQRYVSRDKLEVVLRKPDGSTEHVATVTFDGWHLWSELRLPLPPGSTATIALPACNLRVCFHRVDIPGREAEWYSVAGYDDRFDSVIEIVEQLSEYRASYGTGEKVEDDFGHSNFANGVELFPP